NTEVFFGKGTRLTVV
ncbi:mCG146448, partial [Mus musculus]